MMLTSTQHLGLIVLVTRPDSLRSQTAYPLQPDIFKQVLYFPVLVGR